MNIKIIATWFIFIGLITMMSTFMVDLWTGQYPLTAKIGLTGGIVLIIGLILILINGFIYNKDEDV